MNTFCEFENLFVSESTGINKRYSERTDIKFLQNPPFYLNIISNIKGKGITRM